MSLGEFRPDDVEMNMPDDDLNSRFDFKLGDAVENLAGSMVGLIWALGETDAVVLLNSGLVHSGSPVRRIFALKDLRKYTAPAEIVTDKEFLDAATMRQMCDDDTHAFSDASARSRKMAQTALMYLNNLEVVIKANEELQRQFDAAITSKMELMERLSKAINVLNGTDAQETIIEP